MDNTTEQPQNNFELTPEVKEEYNAYTSGTLQFQNKAQVRHAYDVTITHIINDMIRQKDMSKLHQYDDNLKHARMEYIKKLES